MSPVAILRDVFRAYRRHWRILLGSAFLTFGAVNLVAHLTPDLEFDHLTTFKVIEAAVLGAGSFAVTSFQEAFYEGVVATALGQARAGGPPPRLRTIARSVRYAPLIAVMLVVAVGSGVGLLLLIVPGLVFGTYVGLAPALVEVEQLGVRDSLRRSFQLVRGHFWSVLVLLWGVYFVTEAATSLLDKLLHGFVFEYIAETTAESVIAPIYGLAAVLATYKLIELRERRPPLGDAPAA
jgi:hypothetical protein